MFFNGGNDDRRMNRGSTNALRDSQGLQSSIRMGPVHKHAQKHFHGDMLATAMIQKACRKRNIEKYLEVLHALLICTTRKNLGSRNFLVVPLICNVLIA